MTSADRHQHEWADAVGAYLLEALPEDERADFEAHLATCHVCQEDVAMLRVASDALPASVRQLSPPPELRDRIMAVVQSEADLLAAASGERADLPEERSRERGWLGWLTARPGIAAACVGLLLLVGGVTGAVVSDGDDGRVIPGTFASERVKGGTVKLVVHDTDSKLTVKGMPAPPEGRVYQVWVKRPNRDPEPTSALFTPRAGGDGSVAVPGSLKGIEAVLVTDEPEGGSPEPTRDPIITVDTA